MERTIILLLPVTWAAIAAVIGLMLYKSSEAIFENLQVKSGQKKTFRVAGSALIAGLAFYLIREATPVQNLYLDSRGIVSVSTESLKYVRGSLDDMSKALIESEACMELDQVGGCKSKISDVQRKSRNLRDKIDDILKGRQ